MWCVPYPAVDGYPLTQVEKLGNPGKVYSQCVDQLVQFARVGLVHCDYNEFNILVNEEQEITVIDFPQMVSTKHFNAEVRRCRSTLSNPC